MAYMHIVLGVKVSRQVTGKTKKLEYKDKECLNMIVTNLISSVDSILLYSRDTGGLTMECRKNPKGINGYRIVKAVGWLEKEGYIINTISSAFQLYEDQKDMSYMVGTAKFIKEFVNNETIKQSKKARLDAYPVLEFRGIDGDIKYRNTKVNLSYEENMRMMNSNNAKFDVRDEFNTEVDTIYSRKFRESILYNGRMYSVGVMSIENRETKGRLKMLADTKQLAECDYAAMHLMLMADTHGYQLPHGDAYMNMLPDDMKSASNRQVIKLCFTRLVNCDNKAEAMLSFRKPMSETIGHTFKKPSQVMNLIYKSLDTLTQHLYIDRLGLRLANTESNIMADVIQTFVSLGKLVLTVHDSALTFVEDAELLATTMADAYRKHMQVKRVIRITCSKLEDGTLVKQDYSR